MRILVTGVTGFAGGYLAEALLARGGNRIYGLSRRGSWPAATAHLAQDVELRPCDLCAVGELEALLRGVEPEQIYHLAGYAGVGTSFREPDEVWRGNLTATRSLYDAVLRWQGVRGARSEARATTESGRRSPRILFVGSGLIYGTAEGQAQDERTELRPSSPYAASKAAADLVSYQYTCEPGLDIVRARPFNHIGARQSPQFAVAHFAQQLVAIERGRQPPVLETGNLSPCRDLTDVRDMVAAYVLLMERGRTGEAYNIGSGQVCSIGTVLERLLALSGTTVEIRQRAELVRATDPAAVRADASKLRRETGWVPRYSLDQTLADILTFWRQQREG
jgi:GDP-4-dehydro-6-deoxy-D-mannose reductase